MPSVWVKWPHSHFYYSEITINDVLGEVGRAPSTIPCEALDDPHSEKKYAVKTKLGAYVLCRQCCKVLGLRLPPG
jgi:hypothetical protein